MTDHPAHLRVNHLREALGITDTAPRFSWIPPEDTVRQTAYRIVSSNGWDTGRIFTHQSSHTVYDGPALQSRDRFHWRVQSWNIGMDGLERQSPWSAPMNVEIGLTKPTDWTAQWIGPVETQATPPGGRPGYALSKDFVLEDAPEQARAYATSHGVYELFINGQRVGDQQLTPGSTSYHSTLQVQTFEIASMLRTGRNTVRAVLTDGWFRGTFGYTRAGNMYGDKTAFLAQLEITSAEGLVTISTDKSWDVAVTEVVSADIMGGQHIDFRELAKPTHGGQEQKASPRTAGYGELTGPVAPPTRVVELVTPKSIRRLSNGNQVIDLGQNINGWIRLSKLGKAGDRVILVYGECLDDQGDVTQDHLRPMDFHNPGTFLAAGQVDSVISDGEPGRIFEPRHTIHGFQYVSVQGLAENLHETDVVGCMVQTDLERVGSFICSDDRLNKLHDIVEWSFRGNACEVPTDCPQREKAGWAGDWQLFVPTASFLFDVTGFSEKWLNDVRADQWDNGVIVNISPSPGPEITSADPMSFLNGSAGWGDAIVLVPWEIYLSTGDTHILEQNWDSMNRWLGFIRKTAETGRHPLRAAARPSAEPHEAYLWDSGFHWGEWLEPSGPENDLEAFKTADKGIVATAYYRHTTAIMAKIAAVLGKDPEARALSDLSEEVKRAWQKEYIDDEGFVGDGTPRGSSQANCVRALAFDLVREEDRPVVVEQLVGLIRDADTHLGTGFLATPYLLPALADNEHADLAYELLSQDTEPSWLVMVDRGATTVWEAWNGIDADGSAHESLNHYSKGAVASFLHRYTAGLRQAPGSAGYKRIIIEPRPGAGLTSASAVHRGPQGLISVAWTMNEDDLVLTASVPANSTAVVRIPGRPEVEIGPGTHSFTSAATPAASTIRETVRTGR